ncbi:dihydrolipoyl dehydrogenase [Rickettsia endosymbiont of Cardiosporidium cionae]|uniref:dihydrolipoyl dehydrogenase n=1 Tax=Rickettsia endosymbiont of Cardiosporidium cionae TaxID=2777155 RepID=UPI001893882C|nr:dihydrolipoyl dehydrogenase [Rickettsia endosymbiont of Cardiosporidium cionae]KAF8818439.1 dihydrolipoyl dehydrogenase [Rickettsia endosymbiont of Cardiosporidium cionae]
MDIEFDLIVIGSGPAGYTAAIRAAQLGMKVGCIEKNQRLGGTCLNVGCIPSKALLNFTKKYYEARNLFSDIGINAEVKLDIAKMMSAKDSVVSNLSTGISSLFIKNKVQRFTGVATIKDSNTVLVSSDNGESIQKITTNNILIATGSVVKEFNKVEFDNEIIITSSEALSLPKIPQSISVVGAGYIGLELGSVWNRLGSQVTIIEYSANILPALDKDLTNILHKSLTKQGIKIMCNSEIKSVTKDNNNQVSLVLEDLKDKNTVELVSDIALISVGRKSYMKDLGIEKLNIKIDNTGNIVVNEKYQTSMHNIYAVGDVISGPMLAHKAEKEAVAAVEFMNNQFSEVNYALIPSVVYTSPEIATVGDSEKSLKEKAISYKVGKFPFLANSRANTMLHPEGLVKIFSEMKTGKILGAQIIGPEAGTLIAEVVAYMEFGGSVQDIAMTCHAHPTLNEAIKEAALASDNIAINF